MKRNGKLFFPILEKEIEKRHIRKKHIQEKLNLKQSAFIKKLNGERKFELDEAILIQEAFFPDVTVNELFRHE